MQRALSRAGCDDIHCHGSSAIGLVAGTGSDITQTTTSGFSKRLSAHLNRMGHHIRQTIVDQARATLGDEQLGANGTVAGLPEPIPEKQEDINKQADAAIRDLFPRIPNTDRQMIIEHAFNKVGSPPSFTS